MSWVGLPPDERDRLPAHRLKSGADPATGTAEFWVLGVCGGCGTEWAGHEGAAWPTCSCGGRIFPPRPEGFPHRENADVGGSVAVQGEVQGLVAFRMVETQAAAVVSVWSGAHAQMRESKAHQDAHWPVYSTPPLDRDGYMSWAFNLFRYGPKMRPIQLSEDAIEAYAALDCVKRVTEHEHTVLRCPFGDLLVVDYDPALAIERVARG